MPRSESSASSGSGRRRPAGSFAWFLVLGLVALLASGCGGSGESDSDEERAVADLGSEVDDVGGSSDGDSSDGDSSDEPQDEEVSELDPGEEGTVDDADDLDAFCEAAEPTQRVVDRPFIGSDDHVAMMSAVLEVAPDEIIDDLAALTAHFEHDVHPSNPASQDFPNWSTAMQDTAMRVQSYVSANC